MPEMTIQRPGNRVFGFSTAGAVLGAALSKIVLRITRKWVVRPTRVFLLFWGCRRGRGRGRGSITVVCTVVCIFLIPSFVYRFLPGVGYCDRTAVFLGGTAVGDAIGGLCQFPSGDKGRNDCLPIG